MTDYRLTSASDAAAEEEITQRLVAYNQRHTVGQPAAQPSIHTCARALARGRASYSG